MKWKNGCQLIRYIKQYPDNSCVKAYQLKPMNRVLLFASVFCIVIFSGSVKGQTGGMSTYSFLKLVSSARPASMGGNAIATRADDVSLAVMNPSLMQKDMSNQLSLSYTGYVADIKFGDIAYAYHIPKFGMTFANLQFISYGSFDRTDENSVKDGTFSAGEYALTLGWSKILNSDSSLTLGAAVKGILSDLGDYKSSGVAADVALTWYNADKAWCATAVVKNIGTQITTYEDGDREPLPFEVQMGLSKKLENAPFRFSLIGQQLQKSNLTFKDPEKNTIDPLTGEVKEEKISSLARITQHLIVNAEILFSKSFHVRIGYNVLRRYELGLPEKKGLAGLTAGFGVNINKFRLAYARGSYSPGTGSNHFTVSTTFGKS